MKPKKDAIVQWKIPTVPNEKAITKQTAPLADRAEAFLIKSEDHFVASWAIVLEIDKAIMTVEQLMDPFVAGLYQLHRMACQMRQGFLEPLIDGKNILLGRRKEYRNRLEELKREADAEAARIMQKKQQAELERQAKAADKAGDKEVAEVLREQKAQTPLPFMSTTPAVPKQEGSVVKKRWVYEIVDPTAVEREYCSPDPKLIRPVVEALGEACNIHGIRVTLDESEHSRGVA